MTFSLVAHNALAVLIMMIVLWAWSVYRRDASIVDPWWSMGFLLVAVCTWLSSSGSLSKAVLLGCVALWAVRLWWHLLRRSIGKPEDPRYQQFRKRFGAQRYWWVSLFQVFLLQGALLVLIAVPLEAALAAPLADGFVWNDGVGVVFFAIGFVCEATADSQLQRFRADPSKRGAVLDTGIWRYSRHPNYFGETLIWWGFWLCAVDAPFGVWSVVSPVLLTVLLLRVSGVTMLESQLAKTKPGYAEYVRKTSVFVPWPPKR